MHIRSDKKQILEMLLSAILWENNVHFIMYNSSLPRPAVCWLCPVYVHPVQLYAHSGQEDQCYSSQPLPAHCRPPQPLLWPVSLSIHG